jgi:hypothetical protein
MRQLLAAGFAAATLIAAWGGPASAATDDRTAYYDACVKVSPGLKAACACRADAAMTLASPELRADIILSMSNASAYAARARAGKVSPAIIHQWETFSAESARTCGIDN